MFGIILSFKLLMDILLCNPSLEVLLRHVFGGKLLIRSFPKESATAQLTTLCWCAVFFLTCGGVKTFPDPRMNSLEAAFVFAKTSDLQVDANAILCDQRFHKTEAFLLADCRKVSAK